LLTSKGKGGGRLISRRGKNGGSEKKKDQSVFPGRGSKWTTRSGERGGTDLQEWERKERNTTKGGGGKVRLMSEKKKIAKFPKLL